LTLPCDPMDRAFKRILEKQHYRVVGEGEHSAVKLCHWMRQKLFYGRACYKENFYGIECHRCLQMSPAVNTCNHRCLFCWRNQEFNERTLPGETADDPGVILEESILAQRKLVSGFKGDDRCDVELWKEAQDPTQVAISLAGEPTMYPYLGDFIALCRRRGMTTFLVTNGTVPGALEQLEKMDELPTQLYVTVPAPDFESYRKLCNPYEGRKSWENIMKTLELLPSLDTRTVIRHTLVDGWNMQDVKGYAKLDEMADPTFIEPKGYVFVGASRMRMDLDNMPSHEKVAAFARALGEETGYDLLAEEEKSRVALLGRDKGRMRIGKDEV